MFRATQQEALKCKPVAYCGGALCAKDTNCVG